MEELIYKDIRKDTKQRLIKIVARLQEAEFIEGLVIGGTELSLILSSNDFEEIPVFRYSCYSCKCYCRRNDKKLK